MDIQQTYENLIKNIESWSKSHEDIRVILIAGSRARTQFPADQWSDLDLILFVRDPAKYLGKTNWINEIGEPVCTFIESTSTGGEQERRILFAGMLDVDFAFIPAGFVNGLKWLSRMKRCLPFLLCVLPKKMKALIAKTEGFMDMLQRGYRLLKDKDELGRHLSFFASRKKRTWQPPSPDQFCQLVNDFLYHLVWTVKHLKRGELSDCVISIEIFRLMT